MSIPDRPQTGLPHQRDGRAPAEPAAYPADANTPPPREPRLKRLPGTFGDAGDNEPLPSFLRSRDDSASNVTAFPKIPQPQPDDEDPIEKALSLLKGISTVSVLPERADASGTDPLAPIPAGKPVPDMQVPQPHALFEKVVLRPSGRTGAGSGQPEHGDGERRQGMASLVKLSIVTALAGAAVAAAVVYSGYNPLAADQSGAAITSDAGKPATPDSVDAAMARAGEEKASPGTGKRLTREEIAAAFLRSQNKTAQAPAEAATAAAPDAGAPALQGIAEAVQGIAKDAGAAVNGDGTLVVAAATDDATKPPAIAGTPGAAAQPADEMGRLTNAVVAALSKIGQGELTSSTSQTEQGADDLRSALTGLVGEAERLGQSTDDVVARIDQMLNGELQSSLPKALTATDGKLDTALLVSSYATKPKVGGYLAALEAEGGETVVAAKDDPGFIAGEGGARYLVVEPGDSLSRIALKAYGDPMAYSKIFAANRDKLARVDLLQVGMKLRIP